MDLARKPQLSICNTSSEAAMTNNQPMVATTNMEGKQSMLGTTQTLMSVCRSVQMPDRHGAGESL